MLSSIATINSEPVGELIFLILVNPFFLSLEHTVNNFLFSDNKISNFLSPDKIINESFQDKKSIGQ